MKKELYQITIYSPNPQTIPIMLTQQEYKQYAHIFEVLQNISNCEFHVTPTIEKIQDLIL